MNSPQKQPGKRIVSRVDYLKVQGRLLHLRPAFAMLLLLSCFLILFAGGLVIVGLPYALALSVKEGSFAPLFVVIVLVPLLAGGAYLCNKRFEALELEIRTLNDVVPLTRANAADLPAPASLVRASEEPLQKQQATLLRPAAQYGDAHEEQLLVASIEGDTGA